jgi:hypothetical protein
MRTFLQATLLSGFVVAALTAFTAATRANDPASAQPVATDDKDAKVENNLAKLSPEDRKLAEAQKYCAVEEENRLGAMGKPYKLVLNGETVFLCCKGCLKAAKADPDKTVAKAKELREKNSK